MAMMKEYGARIDTKKRVILRGAKYDNYHVQEYADGRIVLEPRELVAPFKVSKKTLATMDESMKNFKKGGQGFRLGIIGDRDIRDGLLERARDDAHTNTCDLDPNVGSFRDCQHNTPPR